MAFERFQKEKTGWDKAKPYVFGIGIPVVVIIIMTITIVSIFKPSSDENVQDTSTPTGWISTQPHSTNSHNAKSKPVNKPSAYPDNSSNRADTADNIANTTSESTTTIEPSDSTLSVIDTSALRELQEQNIREEIDKMREQYHNNRVSLLNEALSFLRGKHSQRGVKSKASNFKKLGDNLLKKIDEFPQSSSDAEKKLWDAQKDELRRTASFLDKIATRISATNGETRKMRMAASTLESEGAP